MSLYPPNIPHHPALDSLQSLVYQQLGSLGAFTYSQYAPEKRGILRTKLYTYILPSSQYIKKNKKNSKIERGNLLLWLGAWEEGL